MPGTADSYDASAAEYAAHSDASAWNAHYERPAMVRLAGDVEGLNVLDAGCGAGPLSAELVALGATVTAVDRSAGLLSIARERLGEEVRLVTADLAEPLPFEDRDFDVVVASLVLHYLEDWAPPLAEFRRLLAPGGRLVISTHHPFMDHALSGAPDYFATYPIEETFELGEHRMPVRFWHRPLGAIMAAITGAGFRLDAVEEPAPDPVVASLDPKAWASLTTTPRFLFVTATRR